MKQSHALTFRSYAKRGGLLCIVVSFIVSMGWPLREASAQSAAPPYKSVGYFIEWAIYDQDYQVEDIDGSQLTHLNYAFADICWNGRHGNASNAPDNPNKQTWPCKDSGVPTQTGNVPNGAIVLGDPWADVNHDDGIPLEWEDCSKGLCGNFYKLRQLKAQYPHLQTLLSIGGWTWSNRFSDVAADPAARQNFAQSAVHVIRTYGFDGIDIDWEYPVEGGLTGNSERPEDKQNFTLLLQAVRTKLNQAGAEDGRSYLLTIATRANESYLETTEIVQVASLVDWMNVMTYDFHGDWENSTNHNAPLDQDPLAPTTTPGFYTDYAITAYKQAGVPSSKLVLGIPFYGRGWKNCAAGPNQDGQYQSCTPDWNGDVAARGTWDNYETGSTGMFDYGDLTANMVNKNGFTRYWNDAAKVPYLYQPSTGTFISYEDLQSISYKTSYIKNQGLGGAMYWDISMDCRTSPKYQCSGDTLLGRVAQDLNITAPPVDKLPPTTPANVVVSDTASTSAKLTWTPSQDNVGVVGYDVYLGNALYNTASTHSITLTGLTADTNYTASVVARDAAGNISTPSAPVTFNTLPASADTTPPTTPANLSSTSHTDTTISLSWNASTDNVGVTSYPIYVNGALSASPSGSSTTFTLTGLTKETAYSIQIAAADAAGNQSPLSTAIQVTTDAAPSGPLAWALNTAYSVGQEVSYNGDVYTCRIAHTSLTGWEPPAVPALWVKK